MIKGPLHPNNLFPVLSPSLPQPRMNVQSARFHYQVLLPHSFQNSAVRANFHFAEHSPVHQHSPANTGSRSHHILVRGESIPRALLHSGRMCWMWGQYMLVWPGHPSGDDEPSPATLSAPPPALSGAAVKVVVHSGGVGLAYAEAQFRSCGPAEASRPLAPT